MEPRRDDGDDDLLGDGQIPSGQPQWSPVVTTGTTRRRGRHRLIEISAAMEPRRDDGDDSCQTTYRCQPSSPQWSPVVTTGTTSTGSPPARSPRPPQWSPVVTTGTTLVLRAGLAGLPRAAMEPRRDDGDDLDAALSGFVSSGPQWSPVVTTGTTRGAQAIAAT